ncbi:MULTISPECIES: hypothetical protein [Pelosinus]|uniref:Uncharacterized protein n=1 Tax=Pelosinus fermentans B4 TaxID=1149862 RepID=I8RKY1_9FIRM|nr:MULTISPECIES: hypothetical protein [Pelosinus]EIW19145.1 hypothetical protein FB4_2855 [Pelosinus fermentans B4]EIW25123.1 hypothetical protein FA11_2983 [Pelosinus fermentans A11]OAM96126.1 hypothetical protein FR7_04148 [Pelosinus fermentans DSM 17108]SDR36628.1 hypothetical protein SAMN04515679_4319 [Pelosinus fermentans]
MMKMREIIKIVLFAIIAFFLIILDRVDAWNDVIVFSDPSKQSRFQFFMFAISIWGAMVTVSFPLKKRLLLFFCASCLFHIVHGIWFSIGAVVDYKEDIPISYGMAAYRVGEAMKSFAMVPSFWNVIMTGIMYLATFAFFGVAMVGTLAIKKIYEQIKNAVKNKGGNYKIQ